MKQTESNQLLAEEKMEIERKIHHPGETPRVTS